MNVKGMDMRTQLRKPWLLAILCIALIPLFPEFISPLLAGGALWLAVRDARQNHRTVCVGFLGKLLLIYMGYMAFGVLYSANPFNSLSTLLMWVTMFLVYITMTTVLTTRRRFDTALFCIVASAGVVGLISALQYFLGKVTDGATPMQVWSFVDRIVYQWLPISVEIPDFGLRAASTFNNPNVVAEYLVMVVPFAVYYATRAHRTLIKWIARIATVAALLGVAFSFSRGSYLALLALGAVLCIANIRKMTILILGIISCLVLIPNVFVERLVTVGNTLTEVSTVVDAGISSMPLPTGTDVAISERFTVWGIALKNIVQNPLFGMGPGVQNSWDMLIAGGVDAPHTHNLVLQLLVEGGVIALAIMLLIGWKTLRTGVHLVTASPESKLLGIVFVGFVAAFCMHSMVDFPLLSPKLVATFMMVLGLSDCASRLYANEKLEALHTVLPIDLLRRRRLAEQGVAYSETK